MTISILYPTYLHLHVNVNHIFMEQKGSLVREGEQVVLDDWFIRRLFSPEAAAPFFSHMPCQLSVTSCHCAHFI